ncbi:hypothetical protein A2U01_0087408, partial [Trifolium medium]|nr:hypothetical protein [Trifolium medium]
MNRLGGWLRHLVFEVTPTGSTRKLSGIQFLIPVSRDFMTPFFTTSPRIEVTSSRNCTTGLQSSSFL